MATENAVVRSVVAPTEAEARTMAAPVLDAFRWLDWELREALWIPGDRRPGLGESLLLSPESQLLLEGEGTLRLTFVNTDPLAVPPVVAPAARNPDAFEDLGGVRYRRLVPRWGAGVIVLLLGLVVFLVLSSRLSYGPFSAAPTPESGVCPVGWIPGMELGPGGALTPDGTCERFP